MLVDAGSAFVAPVAPTRAGWAFEAWYADAACETPYDFAKTPVENGVAEGGTLRLYAKYLAKRGQLPTTDGAENATWELSDDGTLKIASAPGATIKSIGWDPTKADANVEGKWNDKHWGSMRDEVGRIEMAPGLKAEDTDCWFAEMHNLVDVSGAYVPEGVQKVNRMFFRCTSLGVVSDGFSIPEGVVEASDMFGYCSSLASLPSGFTLPTTLTNANHLFDSCTSLERVPLNCLMVCKTQWVCSEDASA